jgi:hypothetical protein
MDTHPMTTTHAWFSSIVALRQGSSVYRKVDGSTVNVTRTDAVRDAGGRAGGEEQYVGEVVGAADGGCVRPLTRVRGIGGA